MLLVTGGHNDVKGYLSTTELLSLNSPTGWTPAASLPQAMYYHRVASLPGSAGLYCLGGRYWAGKPAQDYRVKDEVKTPHTLSLRII